MIMRAAANAILSLTTFKAGHEVIYLEGGGGVADIYLLVVSHISLRYGTIHKSI